MNYTYILKCKDGSLYTGWTNDIEKRLQAHRSGKGAKYTRGRGPLELVYLEGWDTKSEAMSREVYIKSLNKEQKLDLLESGEWRDKLGQWGLAGLKVRDSEGISKND
jgi:putative endonuclease